MIKKNIMVLVLAFSLTLGLVPSIATYTAVKETSTTIETRQATDEVVPTNYEKKFIDISESYDVNAMCLTATIYSDYTFSVGTSIAAPKVAALIICKNKELTPKEVGKIIYKSADKLTKDSSNEYYGAGMINEYNAIKYMNKLKN